MGAMNDCILWAGARKPNGYGQRRLPGGRFTSAHRQAWVEAHGPIPAGMVVMHRCDNPPCVNVDHLMLGTQADNLADMRRKGRAGRGAARGEAAPSAKLTWVQVESIRQRVANGERPIDLAAEFGLSRSSVHSIVHYKTWATSKPTNQQEND